jgi:crossover junction endodeoxyribonuclease RuvC
MADTGWAVLEPGPLGGPSLLASGLIRTSPRLETPERLREMHAALSGVLRDHRPGEMAIEEMFFLKAALSIRATLHARGVLLLAAAQARVGVREYNPRQVKIALTGSGSAAKSQIQHMVRSALGLPGLLRPDDVADAAAIAICHLRLSRSKSMRVLGRIGGAR